MVSSLAIAAFLIPTIYAYTPLWLTLPPTPRLPRSRASGYVPTTEGAEIWYSFYGKSLKHTLSAGDPPLLFLHGGLSSSDYFGNQIKDLLKAHITMLAIDSRGHGRSTDGSGPITYDKMTNDVIAVLDHFAIPKVAIVGWSDGGIIGLDMAMNYSSRLDRLFAFGASYDPSNILPSVLTSDIFNAFLNRARAEYEKLNPNPDWPVFEEKMTTLWSTEPRWNQASFAQIPTPYNDTDAPLIWIVAGDHEEAITPETPRQMFEWIPGSGLVILPEVSHFAPLQDPDTFTAMIKRFLAREK